MLQLSLRLYSARLIDFIVFETQYRVNTRKHSHHRGTEGVRSAPPHTFLVWLFFQDLITNTIIKGWAILINRSVCHNALPLYSSSRTSAKTSSQLAWYNLCDIASWVQISLHSIKVQLIALVYIATVLFPHVVIFVALNISRSQTLFFLCVGAGRKGSGELNVSSAPLAYAQILGIWTAQLPEWRKLLTALGAHYIIKMNCSLPVLTVRLRSSDDWLCLLYLWAVHSSPLIILFEIACQHNYVI